VAQALARDERYLARFFGAAALALVFSAVHGFVQRLPGIGRWLLDADYGGYMVTNLAHTHITLIGAGTLIIGALTYYILPRLLGRPLYSYGLAEMSFWCTLFGVFGFYFAQLGLGIAEGVLVHQGHPYGEAKEMLGAAHKLPVALTAAVLGLGYWTFTLNVLLTVVNSHGAGRREDGYIVKFLFMGAAGLFLGTVQGVYQVLPWSVDWLHRAGEAGRLIDPAAHAHINLVGGVAMAIAGFVYYFLPRVTGRPIYSRRLADASFYIATVGVLAFWLGLIVLAFVEGNMIIDQGIDFQEAKDRVGIWHPLVFGGTGAMMGVGLWLFIANALLSLRGHRAGEEAGGAPWQGWLVLPLGALLLGTVQGVVQAQDAYQEWLLDAGRAGVLVTPLSHAQLNIIGFVLAALLFFSLLVLPRVVQRPLTPRRLAGVSFGLLTAGVAGAYASLLALGFAEGARVRGGTLYPRVLDDFGLWHDVPLAVSYALVGAAYVAFATVVVRTIGWEAIRAYFGNQATSFWRELVTVEAGARPTSLRRARQRANLALAVEVGGGWVGFAGLGWMMTGRALAGGLLFLAWFAFYWLSMVLALTDNLGPVSFGELAPVYGLLPVASGAGLWRSYLRAVAPRGQTPVRPGEAPVGR
jgi:cytochrome c oxidase cbb3-type subunit 1